MEHNIDARAFGRLEGEVQNLHTMLESQNKTLAVLTIQLQEVRNTLAEAKGGWRALVLIGGASAAAATGVQWLLQHIKL